ncbi:hypothetical protein Tco_0019235 [Tanacetum coccineum]
MTHDLSLGIVKFTNRANEIAYKMPHKIEQFNLTSDFEKEHTKSVYFRNKEDKRRGVDYVMNNILGFYKECLELGPEYLTELEGCEDISSIIDPRLSQVVLGKPFVEISNMTHDLSLGIVKFTNGANEIAYKMPHKIEQFNLTSDFEKEHTKSVYFRNEEDKRKGVDYVMNNILGFYKECLELGPEYLTELEGCEVSNERGVT